MEQAGPALQPVGPMAFLCCPPPTSGHLADALPDYTQGFSAAGLLSCGVLPFLLSSL